jgi:hypothetical protein
MVVEINRKEQFHQNFLLTSASFEFCFVFIIQIMYSFVAPAPSAGSAGPTPQSDWPVGGRLCPPGGVSLRARAMLQSHQ